jgi:hypothetical protein
MFWEPPLGLLPLPALPLRPLPLPAVISHLWSLKITLSSVWVRPFFLVPLPRRNLLQPHMLLSSLVFCSGLSGRVHDALTG